MSSQALRINQPNQVMSTKLVKPISNVKPNKSIPNVLVSYSACPSSTGTENQIARQQKTEQTKTKSIFNMA